MLILNTRQLSGEKTLKCHQTQPILHTLLFPANGRQGKEKKKAKERTKG
jgi:hypothetical protein